MSKRERERERERERGRERERERERERGREGGNIKTTKPNDAGILSNLISIHNHDSPPPLNRSKLLARFPDSDGRNTYKYDDFHDFHLYSAGGLFFLCLAEHGVQLRVAYGLLTALQEKFVSNYDGRWQRANAYAMSDFAHVISGELKRFNDPESDKMHRLKNDIADVKDVMRNNITKVLERGEQIELLVDKSEALRESAVVFHKRAKKLKWAMCRENAKLWIIIFVVILVVIGIIVATVCGGGHCGGGNSGGAGGGGGGATPSAASQRSFRKYDE